MEDGKTLRLGLRFVKGLREAPVQAMLAVRAKAIFTSMDDFLRRSNFTAPERRALAAVGALDAITRHRRAALLQVETAWSDDDSLFKQFDETDRGDTPLPSMSVTEEVQADFSGQTFKHILVPVWVLAYTYGAQSYQVVVNGYTGAMAGKHPLSWVKIVLTVLAVLIVIAIIAAMSSR